MKKNKLERKYQENRKVLERWHQSILEYKVLSSREIKKLIKELGNTSDEKEQVEIRNTIIMGSLEYIYEYLKQSVFIDVVCNWFSMEDIINATIEAWIKVLTNAFVNTRTKRYAIDSDYTLYGKGFKHKIMANLEGSNVQAYIHSKNMVEYINILDWYYIYLDVREEKTNMDYAYFKMMIVNSNLFSEEKLRKVYAICLYLDKVFKIRNGSKEKIYELKYLIYNSLDMAILMDKKDTSEDVLLDLLLARDLAYNALLLNATPVGKIDEVSAKRRVDALIKTFYEEESAGEITQDLGITRSRVLKITDDAIERVRKKYASWQDDI